MQLGMFTAGDVTTDPATGRAPTEAGRGDRDGHDRAAGRRAGDPGEPTADDETTTEVAR